MRAQPASEPNDHPTGAQLGKYQLLATLGQGGMGTVHLALASGLGQFRKLLVVKELRQDLTRQPGFVSMFMDEAKLAARLAHPNVVQTFEASAVGERYLLAMEYLDGYPLSCLLDRLAQAPISKLTLWMHLQILCDVLAGLHYAHELLDYDGTSLQVVHRDVSPQNVFITYHGQVKVVDFGVAKATNATVKTAPGTFVGKFSYASPEQVLGSGVDARTDVFAVGVMLWEALARRSFSEREPTPSACRARVEGLEPRIADVVPTVDPVLARICDRALAVDIDERFASAKEFRYALQNYMQLAGVRIESTEIGMLMQDVFAAERRALHARIEQAVGRNGMSKAAVDALPIFHVPEKVPTAIADLSSLIQVSVEEDEQKLQKSYAHSKVTLVRPNGKRETVMFTPTGSYKSRNPLIAFLSLSALAGVSLAVLSHRDDSTQPPTTDTKGSFATSAGGDSASTSTQHTVRPAPIPAVPKADRPIRSDRIIRPGQGQTSGQAPVSDTTYNTYDSSAPKARAVSAPLSGRAAPLLDPSNRETRAAAREARESRHADSSKHDEPTRTRAAAVPARAAAPVDPPREAPARSSKPAAANSSTSIDEGTDLTFGRRVPFVRIDSENPYQ
jgi:eukaryotic-like serine/threonine-protein kinase